MSAIAGIQYFNNEPVSIDHSKRIMKSFAKFPAQDSKTLIKESIFLGCHAQWITPESIGEQLPYYDQDRGIAITVDAIIDNRKELFDKLDIEKSLRKAMPDSQIILLAYLKWGEESPNYLIGDFAFMIWDERKQLLFGARDFSGSRTLYYYNDLKLFAFGTTIESLLSLPLIEKQLNEQWLAEFLAISGMIDTVDGSITPYKNIQQLPPSHSITIIKGNVSLKRFCKLISAPKLKLKFDYEYVEAFQEIFQEAVISRLRTNRQVGAQLSGGLDSGSIVSFAVGALRNKKKKLHTFSYYPPDDFVDFTPSHITPDERSFIKSTVNYVGGINDHYLNFEGRNPYTEIDDFLDVMEMPYKFFENSFWLKGMFEKAQEENVGILLNGGRGNLTISWGSAIDYYSILLKRFKWLRLYQELNHYSQNVGGARLRRLPVITRVAFPNLFALLSSKDHVYRNPRLISHEFAEHTDVFNKLKKYGIDESGWFSESNIYKQRKRHFDDVFHWNASNTLATKLSLRHALWKRDPTNDLRVVRFCLALPEEQYVKNGMDRALVRRATKGLLPDEIRLNQRIRGVQGADWVHRMIPSWNGFLKAVQEMINDKQVMSYLNNEIILRTCQNVKNGVSPKYVLDPNSKVLMRSLVVYKFLKKLN